MLHVIHVSALSFDRDALWDDRSFATPAIDRATINLINQRFSLVGWLWTSSRQVSRPSDASTSSLIFRPVDAWVSSNCTALQSCANQRGYYLQTAQCWQLTAQRRRSMVARTSDRLTAHSDRSIAQTRRSGVTITSLAITIRLMWVCYIITWKRYYYLLA